MTPGGTPALHALLLVGTVGSGKTTVLLEIGRRLEDRGEPYALVDLDWLAWVAPAHGSPLTVHDVLVANLAGAVETFRTAGVTRLALARDVTTRSELEAIRAALGGARLTIVRLDAPPPVLERRVRGRDTGADLAEHLAEIRVAAAAPPPPFPHVAVSNDERPVADVAADVLAAAGW
jgi:cytosine/adenosine deaminase-related metal-dependent hydrolase